MPPEPNRSSCKLIILQRRALGRYLVLCFARKFARVTQRAAIRVIRTQPYACPIKLRPSPKEDFVFSWLSLVVVYTSVFAKVADLGVSHIIYPVFTITGPSNSGAHPYQQNPTSESHVKNPSESLVSDLSSAMQLGRFRARYATCGDSRYKFPALRVAYINDPFALITFQR